MKMQHYPLALLSGMLLAFSSFAVEPPESAAAPNQQQLSRLLSGNTLDGVWAARPYRQFFSASGSTRYKETEGAESSGRWRINSQGWYCSVWPPSDREVCYQVLVEGNNIYWKSGDDYYPSIVIKGDAF